MRLAIHRAREHTPTPSAPSPAVKSATGALAQPQFATCGEAIATLPQFSKLRQVLDAARPMLEGASRSQGILAILNSKRFKGTIFTPTNEVCSDHLGGGRGARARRVSVCADAGAGTDAACPSPLPRPPPLLAPLPRASSFTRHHKHHTRSKLQAFDKFQQKYGVDLANRTVLAQITRVSPHAVAEVLG